MRIIVQKFGGAPLGTQDGRDKAVEKVAAAKAEGLSPVVVVSPMGRRGDPYAEETLIGLVKNMGVEVPKHDAKMLIACGGIISAIVMVQSLEAAGIAAVAMTEQPAGNGLEDSSVTTHRTETTTDKIHRYLGDDKVVVVAGFSGNQPGEVLISGEGDSDTAAALLGVLLEAETVEFYTDADGVMTGDPAIVPDATVLRKLSYQEVCELASQGAGIVHPKAVEIAREKAIPVRVRNNFSKDEGTLIAEDIASRVITGIAQQPGLAQVIIRAGQGEHLSPLDSVRVFKTLAGAGISVDMNSVAPDRITFVVRQELLTRTAELLGPFAYQLQTVGACAKVSVVGAGMQETLGIMARVVE
ncbi:MAG TPA: aspartate kinase, partial [Bacillota bacterium]|nr:aspartate kinase [Bacillota bacterium]